MLEMGSQEIAMARFLLVACLLMLGGCKAEVKAPGVKVNVGPGGVSVDAPGAKVDVGPGGAKVDVDKKPE